MKSLVQINLYDDNNGYTGFGKLGLENELATNADLVFSQFISSAIGLITIIAIIWFLFTLITGAIGFISSGGDKTAIEGARKKIISGLIGLIVTVVGVFIVKFIGYLIGLPDILNFQAMFATITGNVVQGTP